MDAYGKRPFSPHEVAAVVRYYRTLGRHLGISDIPESFEEFAELMDSYEAEHFAFDEGARRVADVTLGLVSSFYPRPARRAVDVFSRSLMDEPLRRAFRYDAPHPAVVRACRGTLRARGRLLRFFPPRRRPKLVEDFSWVRSYPDGYDLSQLGTFPAGCPVPHARAESTSDGTASNDVGRTA
jgi:hypothetical protein